MKIFHHVFTSDGSEVEKKEVTSWTAQNRLAWMKYEKKILAANPLWHFRLSVTMEEGDGQHFENVPPWKSMLAAKLLDGKVQADLKDMVKPSDRLAPKFFEVTRH